MKKKLILLLLLLIPFIVKAEEGPFSLAFTTKEVSYSFDNTYFNNGYVFLHEEGTDTYLRYYNNLGELQKEIKYENKTAYTVFTYNDYLYVLLANGNTTHLLRYDNEFNELNDLELGTNFYPSSLYTDGPMQIYLFHIRFKEDVILKDNKIYLPDWYSNFIFVINDDLSSFTKINFTEDEKDSYLDEYYPVYSKLLRVSEIEDDFESNPTFGYATPVVFNDNYILSNKTVSCSDQTNTACNIITLYDKDFNKLWSKTIENTNITIYATLLDDYIVLNTVDDSKAYIHVLDYEGNIVQIIPNTSTNDNNYYIGVNPTPKGFAVINTDSTTEIDEIYVLNHPIEATTDGHGTVTVKETAIPGEVVTIEVTSNKGYSLSELIVTDAAGNRLPVEHNTFVMGESKVTVKAMFTPDNPNTGNLYIAVVITLAFVSGVALIFQKRRLEFLK